VGLSAPRRRDAILDPQGFDEDFSRRPFEKNAAK
jgi:hypothetical protein